MKKDKTKQQYEQKKHKRALKAAKRRKQWSKTKHEWNVELWRK